MVAQISADQRLLGIYRLIWVLSALATGQVQTRRDQCRRRPYHRAIALVAPALHLGGGSQCLPFRTM